MKKIIIGAFILSIFGCSPEEIQKEIKDCNCNKVVEVFTMNIVAGNGQVGVTKYYKYITINECTGVQRMSGSSTNYVAVGQCK